MSYLFSHEAAQFSLLSDSNVTVGVVSRRVSNLYLWMADGAHGLTTQNVPEHVGEGSLPRNESVIIQSKLSCVYDQLNLNLTDGTRYYSTRIEVATSCTIAITLNM